MATQTAAAIASTLATAVQTRWSKNNPEILDNLVALSTSIGEAVATAISGADTDEDTAYAAADAAVVAAYALTTTPGGASLVGVYDALGIITATTTEAALAEIVGQLPIYARGVSITDVANLAAFVVSNNGVTYAAGDVVLLANQTTAAQCGVYVVGTVSGTAPLTRHPRFPAAAAWRNGQVVHVSEGTLFAGSTWKAMVTGSAVIATNDPLFYPQNVRGTLTLSSGTKTLGATEGLYIFSTTKSSVELTFNTAGGTRTLTIMYGSAVADRTAGKSGTAAAIVLAVVAAGSIQNQDNSTVDFCVTNW